MTLQVLPKELQDEVCSSGVEILVGKLSALTLQPTIFDGIKGEQELDPSLLKIKEEVLEGKRTDFEVSADGVLGFKGRLCVPANEDLKQQIMHEAHNTPYSVHPGTTKMYQDLKGLFWWPGMKRDVVKYVEKYFQGSWNKYLPLIEFAYNNSYQATIGMTPYEALYGRKCRSPIHWHESGEQKFMEPNFVTATTEVVKQIREKMKATRDRQKSYADTQ
ncbi:hypothetical protein UlMin_023083 [Ulmus minor]